MLRNVSRRGFMKAAGSAALLEALPRFPTAAQPKSRPNVILCMADDQGWGETGYNGNPVLKTPVLDEMAARGLRFDRFYSAAPVCSPTRASCMTGRHPNRSGVFSWGWALRPEEITIAQVLKQAGYRTGHFGKWHLGPVKADSPVNPGKCGFDEYLSHDNFFEIDPPLSRNGAPPEIIKGESSEIVVNAALDFVRKSKGDQPLFIVVWFGSPHAPYRGTPEDMARYPDQDKTMQPRYAEITALDRAMGLLRRGLREMKIADNTLLWYCSDNGIPVKEGWNANLRGMKGNLYEGGVRVPGIIEWPAVITKPLATSMPCVTSDIFPTVLDLLGIELPKRPIDGVSLKPLLLERSMSERPKPIGFWVYPQKEELKNEPWMSADLLGTTPTASKARVPFSNHRHPVARTEGFEGSAVWRENRYKLVVNQKATELFDIVADPLEKNNLAAAQADLVKKMESAMHDWQRSVEKSLSGADYRK